MNPYTPSSSRESTATQLTLLSSAEVWDRIDPLLPDLHADPAVVGLGALPYKKLEGPGFERLCYELLVAERHSPRFFGRSGQKDLGVDIIVEADTRRTVYQCKNLAEEPSWTEIRDAIVKFETDWLGNAGLPSVDGFVYCCPHPLDDRPLGEEWTRFKDDFQRRTGVEISFLDRHGLDARLSRLPDLVAGLFSGSYAEHFCGRDGWLDDPWTRLQYGEPRHASIARFLDRHQRGAIHVPEELEERFRDLLGDSPVAVLRGLPGSGKTLTGLEMVSRLREPVRRIYYATLGSSTDFERLWQSVRRRTSLPAVFVLDDCHYNLEKAGLILERLTPELSDAKSRIKLLLILRDTAGSAGQLDDTPDWLLQLDQDERVINSEVGLERTRAVTLQLRPELAGLSKQRLKRLHYTSGGDLLLLDEALSSVSSLQDLDTISPDSLYGSLRSRYFGGNRRLPTVQRLACLAQFELVPSASLLDAGWLPGEKELVAPLMTELFAPPRYQFLHSSLAELVLRALLTLECEVAHLEERVVDRSTTTLVAYLKHLLASGGIDSQPWFITSLEAALRRRLNLAKIAVDAQIKAGVLADEIIRSAVEKNLGLCTFTFLHACMEHLSIADHPAKKQYLELIERRFGMLFQPGRPDSAVIATLDKGFLTLARHSSPSLGAVEREYGADRFIQLITANGTLAELFGVLQYATPAFRQTLLDRIDDPIAEILMDRTIASGHTIGILGLVLRELGNEDMMFLERLESTIGAERFLRLIAANGTLFDLYRLPQYASPSFRSALLDRLDDTFIGALVDKAVTSGRSIGTLHLVMRELATINPVLLGLLQTAIGVEQFLRLILVKGTLIELFSILEYATPSFRFALLDRIDDTYAGSLVDKTIASGRSIGTLNLMMRELGNADPILLRRLETVIGVERFLRLILANGTLTELFTILQRATPDFRLSLLNRLDKISTRALVDKTIAAGRPLNSLYFKVGAFNRDQAQHGRLEALVGIDGWWRLVVGIGNLNDLSLISDAMSDDLRGSFIEASSVFTNAQWCRIIARGLFLNACSFATTELPAYPAASQVAFRRALGQTATALAAKATWFDLNPSRLPADLDSPEGRILRDALQPRIERFQVEDLLGLDFREAVNGFAFGWRERPDLHAALGERLWDILPDPAKWPREDGEVAALRIILSIARSQEVSLPDAHRLLDLVASFLDPNVCTEMATLPLFLLLWNMASLDYERRANGVFDGTLPDRLTETLAHILRERVKAKGLKKEKLAQLTLGGLLGLLAPRLGKDLRRTLAPLAKSTHELRPLVLEQTFVPALFALEGLALLYPGEGVFTPLVCYSLLAKSEEYKEVGPAIEHLRERVKRYSKRR